MCARTSSLRDVSVHRFHLIPPSGNEKRFHQKRGSEPSHNKLFSGKIFEEKIKVFKSHLLERGYPEKLIQTTLLDGKFEERTELALQPKQKENKRILPFVTTYQPSVPNLKQILTKKWHVIEQQPLLSEIYRDPPLISYKRGRSLKEKG